MHARRCWSLLLAGPVALLAVLSCAGSLRAEPPQAAAPATEDAQSFPPESIEFFEKRVRPVLVQHCFECHGEKAKGGLRLDSRAAVLAGGDGGVVAKPGDTQHSSLLDALKHHDEPKMPPSSKLPQDKIDALTHWVALGLPWPVESAAKPAAAVGAADTAKTHWAFQPVKSQPVPHIQGADSVQSPIDAFVLAKLQLQKMKPAAPADRVTLLRRATFDLWGLPPAPADVEQFVSDRSPDAFAKVVDRLLAGPQYGERWGRYWLDIARYADTKGYVFMEDRRYPFAYLYRDWVIGALNRDLPYDRFLLEQIAADRLPLEGSKESLAALGFLAVGRRFLNNQHDIIDDRIDVLARGTLGLTVTCARCHDHKYDPIPTKDYYSLYGVLASTVEPKEPANMMTLADAEKPFAPVVFLRGNPGSRGEKVPRQFLSVLAGPDRQPFKDGSGRLELAQAIANRDNPLTARVMVNRVWQRHFGVGLVRTPSDFGLRSDPPTHPELLDFLATRFMDDGWSVKQLHRMMMLSDTYQQTCQDNPENRRLDPENRLLWRMNRQRLDFEAMRDAILAVAGSLDGKLGGPAEDLATLPYSQRRTIYGLVDRQNLPAMFRAFDFANPDTHSPQRYNTTVPQQSLYLMNNPFVLEQARALAARIEAQAPGAAIADRVKLLYRWLYGRAPDDAEVELAGNFVTGETPAKAADIWQFGYGRYDAESKRVTEFTELPYFNGTAWQGGKSQPDPKTGWVMLNAEGGHPGNDAAHSAIRRFIAPADGEISVHGKLEHLTADGDGVQGRVVSSRLGEVGAWTAMNGKTEAHVPKIKVQAGDAIDFIVECRANENSDSFRWIARVKLHAAETPNEWESKAGFHGPTPAPLSPWQRYVHALLLSNEFQFVD